MAMVVGQREGGGRKGEENDTDIWDSFRENCPTVKML